MLFPDLAWEERDVTDGQLRLCASFLSREEADTLFARLRDESDWQQERLRMYGRWVQQPRLTAWYGRGMSATSRYTEQAPAQPWPPWLAPIRERICAGVAATFNSALANYYRDGQDSLALHADNEACLGTNPVIASLSLGEARRFVCRRNDKSAREEIRLPHGSLLIMGGSFQHHWVHGVPKTKKPVGPRINLTFRQLRET